MRFGLFTAATTALADSAQLKRNACSTVFLLDFEITIGIWRSRWALQMGTTHSIAEVDLGAAETEPEGPGR